MTSYAERSPAACADTASSAIRALNHLTLDPRGCVLDDVYAVLGALGEMMARLEQSTLQIAHVLECRLTEGELRADASGGDTAAAVVQACRDDLVSASDLAQRLEALISGAHRRVGTLADAPSPDGEVGRPAGWAIHWPMQHRSTPSPSRSL